MGALLPRVRQISSVKLGCGAVAAVVALGLVTTLWTHGTGEIRHRGGILRVPVPYASIKISSSEDQATYFTLGYPDLVGTFTNRGRALGWVFVDRMGALHLIASASDDKLRLVAITELKTRFFTQIEFRIEDRRTGGP